MEPAVIGLFPRDRLGFVPDEALGYALRSVLDHLSGPVVLENLPWNVFQLADLYRIARRNMVLVTLKASDGIVERRRAQRRYCKRCYPVPAIQTDDNFCLRCGDALAYRSDDEIAMFAERLTLRRVHTVQMVSLAHRLGVPIVELDATVAPLKLTQHVLEYVALGTCTAA
jgi:hypothetical protein